MFDKSICGSCTGTCGLSKGIVTPPIPVPKNPASSGTCGIGGVTGGTNIWSSLTGGGGATGLSIGVSPLSCACVYPLGCSGE